ncbi:MAG: hypothetical protein OXR82_00165 [Gammaproteobacteria bacterium]|nr:hypothetical protein [Gammaproteobacteria bacterium]
MSEWLEDDVNTVTALLESIAVALAVLVDRPSEIDTLIKEVRGLREDVRGLESAIRASAMKNGGETPSE